MGSNDQYITAGFILIITVLIGGLLYHFLPNSVGDFVNSTVSNILNSFSTGIGGV